LPPLLPPPLDASQRGRLKLLKQAAAAIATDWGLASEVLLPAKDYELMIRLGSGESVEAPERWSGWRQQSVVQPLLLLAGVKE
jgi:hypothetical protein